VKSNRKGTIMKFICLGYFNPENFDAMSETTANAMFDECFAYDDILRANGHFTGGEALQPADTAKFVRSKNGKVIVTDGPFVETKEMLGGILILEARDMDHAVELMSKHPAARWGSSWEIRPTADLSEMMRASEQRRKKK
jgi:hypothetical protein